MNATYEFPILDNLDTSEPADWSPVSDASALLSNLLTVHKLVMVVLEREPGDHERDEAMATVASVVDPYVAAVEAAQVPVWVRSCAATAVPVLRAVLADEGFIPGNFTEFGVGYKVMIEKYQAANAA